MTSAGDGTILVSAGEVSGDHYAARLCQELRARGVERVCGLCGAEGASAGAEALWSGKRLQLLGITEVLGSIADIWHLLGEMSAFVLDTKPRALVFVDSPDFHLPLIRRLRRRGYGGKIFYVSPPSVWAWRSYRVKDLLRHVDECLPLFRFEHEFLKKAGVNSFWTGHPLAEDLEDFKADTKSVTGGISRGLTAPDPDRIVALLPGSRRSEIEQLWPVLAPLSDALESRGFSPVFSVAPGLSERAKNFLMKNLADSGKNYYEGAGRELMAISKAVAGSSGTATAEALLLRRFMVVMYRMKPLSAFIGRLLLSHLYFAIPNLLAGEMFYPELIQERATPEAALEELSAWLGMNPSGRKAKEARMAELAALMGGRGAYAFWADRIMGAM
ncbi:MAG: lipid-A-disaccharide synthase [Synergistaceae bacterium]|nr:lipid-A-disaccharide synthase [Synergistaceae bacterium]